MRTGKLITLMIAGLSLTTVACVQSKRISSGNVFYKYDMESGSTVLHRYEVKKSFKGNITDKGGYIVIKPDSSSMIKGTKYTTYSEVALKRNATGTDALIEASQAYFFKNIDEDNRKRFVFYDSQLMLQSLSIPLKVRPELTGPEFGEAFPQQVESGFNFGFAVGWKFNKNLYRTSTNLLGLNNNQISVAPGLLLNFGSTTLDDDNTIPAFTVNRKAFTYSGGVALLFGFNRMNFGVARGYDYVTGNGKTDWVYQGKPWTGFILALDLLK